MNLSDYYFVDSNQMSVIDGIELIIFYRLLFMARRSDLLKNCLNVNSGGEKLIIHLNYASHYTQKC